MPNIEIKAHCKDLGQARAIALQINTEEIGVLNQVDTYFKTAQGRLKLREINDIHAELIPYIKDYKSGPTKSEYAVIPVKDPELVKNLLGAVLGFEFVVSKRREVFLYENVRIHLDEVKGLGSFIEFEAVYDHDSESERKLQITKIAWLMEIFKIQNNDLLDRSYIDYQMKKSLHVWS